VENGYRVVGTLISKTAPIYKDFAGIVSDEQIKEIVTNEFDTLKTGGVVLLVVGLVAVAAGLAVGQGLREQR
jgi:hypothetical protein